MGKQPHRLSEFIIVLDEKANKSNKFCVCQECVFGSSFEEAYNNKFANTQELVRRHLKNCTYFKQKYNESEQAEILAKSDKVVSATNNSFQECIDDTGSEVSSATSSLHSDKFRGKKNRIDRYLLQPLSEDQQKYFEQLLLKATVSCEQASLYKSYVSFVSPNCTRWNSHYLCFASILRSRAALKNLATRIEEDDENFKSFPRSILLNISDNEWWKNLTQLKVLLEPYMASLNKLQQDKGNLTKVLHSFGW
ncbi:26580_t:CDS:2, partial [Gigaspora margarita]